MKNSLVRILTFLLAITLAVNLTACGSNNNGVDDVKRSMPSVDDEEYMEYYEGYSDDEEEYFTVDDDKVYEEDDARAAQKYISPFKPANATDKVFCAHNYGFGHHGVDCTVKNKSGTAISAPVVAVKDGTVLTASSTIARGIFVYLDHGDGTQSAYQHLASKTVKQGDKVKQGAKLGMSGSTGNSTGIHLHFELIKCVCGSCKNRKGIEPLWGGITIDKCHVNPCSYIPTL